MSMLVSIVIPVLNEESTIEETLKYLRQLPGEKEIIVVDGGSQDQTVKIVEGLADQVVQTSPGRGRQMNAGAHQANGEVLFFLHSDSSIGVNGITALVDAMQNSSIVGGSFCLKIDDESWPLRFISWSSNIRAKYLKLIFGDQGIFVRKSVFKELGGFPEIELMEDWEFSKRLAKYGKLVFLPERIYTSARRWHRFGVWKTILLMHKIKLLYMLGVDPARLNEIYRNAR